MNENNSPTDVKSLHERAKQGDAEAQNQLGYCYAHGNGVAQDYSEAVRWYRKTAEQGHAEGQHRMGFCYENGRGIQQDYTEAVRWYRMAAEQGLAKAQIAISNCYLFGHGVKKDYIEAVQWIRKAAEQNNASAQWALGYHYYHGKGVSQSYAEAVQWYCKAAEQGFAPAQDSLGSCYKNEKGVEKDLVEAALWYRKAAEQGYIDAQKNLDNIIKMEKFCEFVDSLHEACPICGNRLTTYNDGACASCEKCKYDEVTFRHIKNTLESDLSEQKQREQQKRESDTTYQTQSPSERPRVLGKANKFCGTCDFWMGKRKIFGSPVNASAVEVYGKGKCSAIPRSGKGNLDLEGFNTSCAYWTPWGPLI